VSAVTCFFGAGGVFWDSYLAFWMAVVVRRFLMSMAVCYYRLAYTVITEEIQKCRHRDAQAAVSPEPLYLLVDWQEREKEAKTDVSSEFNTHKQWCCKIRCERVACKGRGLVKGCIQSIEGW